MAMWTVLINNNSGSIQTIEDLGVEMANGDSITFSNQFDYEEIAGSDDLRALVASSDLRVDDPENPGTYLSAANGVKFLSLENLYDLETDYYSKTELTTPSSGAQVDWTNIINAPAFGSPNWGPPVMARVLQIASGKPSSPTAEAMCIDTDDTPDHLYKYNGTAWVDMGAFPDGKKVIDLSNGTENIQTFDSAGDSWNDDGEADNNTVVQISDDGDGNQAQYAYNDTDSKWYKIGDIDFADHFNEAAGKHDASEIDVEGTYSEIGGTPTDLENTIDGINTALENLGTSIDGTTLDGAYDQGGAGAGRTINATDGSVKIDRGGSSNASLELVPKSNLPTTGLADGQIDIKDGILCIYDATRSKWLSVQRQFIVFGRKGRTRNQYLGFYGSRLVSNNSGIRLARAATIVSIAGQIDTTGTCTFNVRRNDVATNVTNLAITAGVGAEDISQNVDLNSGDFIQAQVGATSAVEDPMVVIEIAWRL